MMIHDDDIRGLRFAPCVHDMTALEGLAIRSQTVVASRSDPRPHGMLIAQMTRFCNVSPSGDLAPRADLGQRHRDIAPQPARDGLLLGEIQAMNTQIVRAAFQERDAYRPTQGSCDRRQVAVVELIL